MLFRKLFVTGFLVALLSLPTAFAFGDVGVVLNESLDTSVARITGSGHTAVYFSRICPDSPVRLRLCRPEENGSIMSNYTTLGEDQPYEWNVVPLNVYLYGVEDVRYRPLVSSLKIKRSLEERYREKYLAGYCDNESCRAGSGAEWREMVAATMARSMYVFVIKTSVDQDEQVIAKFNSEPNQNHFNGVIRNCADFARRVINTYFPGATGPDYLNDFGMTSPKAIARSFTRYAERHPEAEFRVLHYAQLPGAIKRSTDCRAGTEQLVRSKKLLVPMVIFGHYALPFVAASYVFTGRFNPQHELEDHPSFEASAMRHQLKVARAEGDDARADELRRLGEQDRGRIVGGSDDWKRYRAAFASVLSAAVQEERIPDRRYLTNFLRRLDKAGTPAVDSNGTLWIELANDGETSRVGLSANNVFAAGSNPQLAHDVVLARIAGILSAPKHSRENMSDFRLDWDLLQHTHWREAATSALARVPEHPSSARAEAPSSGNE